MAKNPFSNCESIDYSDQSLKREKEIKRVLEKLNGGQNVSVVGPPKIGKTKSLHDLSLPTTLKDHGIDPQRNLSVYIDFHGYSNQPREAQIYTLMLDRIVDAARSVGVDLTTSSRNGHTNGTILEKALKETHGHGLNTFLLLDEFDELTRNPNIDGIFFNHLRSLANASDLNVAYVTASRNHLIDLLLERKSSTSLDFFNIFTPVQMGLLSKQDSLRFVKDLLHKADTEFEEDLLDLILQIGGGHPYLLQMAACWIRQFHVTKGTSIEAKDFHMFTRAIQGNAESLFENYWTGLTAREQHVLTALPSTQSQEKYQEELQELLRLCLIVKENGRYKYFSPLLRDYVNRKV